MYFIINFILICLTIGLVSTKELIKCNKESSHKLDLLMMQLSTFGDPEGKFATNQTELASQCSVDKDKIEWIKRYVDRCLTGLTLELMSLNLKDLTTVTNKYCDSPKLSKLFISWSQCGNSALNETIKCWKIYILEFARIAVEKDKIPNKDKQSLICCFYHRFDHCIEESYIKSGEDICPTSVVSGLHSILTEITGESIEIFCGEYQADNDKCDSILDKYKYLNDIQLNKPLNNSPMDSFIEIITSAEMADFKLKTKDEY